MRNFLYIFSMTLAWLGVLLHQDASVGKKMLAILRETRAKATLCKISFGPQTLSGKIMLPAELFHETNSIFFN
jgi:hypothetical protein